MLLVPLVLLLVAVSVATLSIGGLYRAALDGERARLVDLAEYQASLWLGLARSHALREPEASPDALFAQFVAEIQEANRGYSLTGRTREITVAEQLGEDIVFLLSLADPTPVPEQTVPLAGPFADPQRRALAGQSGTTVGLDYRGVQVLAAYTPVEIMGRRIGVVAKIDMAEVRAPYLRMGAFVAVTSLVLVLLGGLAIRWLGSPLLHQLEVSERKYRSLFEGAPDAIVMTTPDGRVLDANPAALALFGYSGRELGHINAVDFYADPEDRAIYLDALKDTGVIRDLPLTLQTREGEARHCLVSSRVVKGHALGDTVLEVVVRDVTALRSAEDSLRASQEEAQRYLDSAEVMMVALDQEGRIRMMNRKACSVLECQGRAEGCELLGTDWFERCTPPEVEARARPRFRELMSPGESPPGHAVHSESRVASAGGSHPIIAWHDTVLTDPAGHPTGLLRSGVDVTKRRRAEAEASRATAMYQRLHDHMLDAFALHRMVWAEDGSPEDYVFLAVNPAFESLTGLTAGHAVGKRVSELIPGLEPTWLQTYGDVVRSGVPLAFERYAGPLGRHFEVQAFRTGPSEFGTIFRNITERVRTSTELARSRSSLRRLARRTEAVREEERRTLARELHDGLGQALTALHIDLSILQGEIGSPDHKEQLGQLVAMVEQHIGLTQSLSARLRPPVLDHLGLAAAIRWEAERMGKRTDLSILVDVPSGALGLSTEAEVALFRIVQEALTNTVRHAAARTVWIDIRVHREATVLSVRDDGRGFSEEDATGVESLGLLGMRERTLAIGGTLDLTNGLEGGACVTVSVPHATAANSAARPA